MLLFRHASQLIEVIFTNGGFIVITILFISRYITKARTEYEQLQEFNNLANQPSIFEQNCKFFQLTSRECEIVHLIRLGCKYKEIAENLFISEKTVSKHVQNIYEKTEVGNKIELIHKLEQKPVSGSNSVPEAPQS